MDRMTLAGALERRGVRAAYVAGAGVLVAGLLLLTQAALVPGWIALIVVVAYLGPLGLAALLLLAVPAVLVLGSPPPALGFLGVAVAVGVAALNVAILRRWARDRREVRGMPTAGRGRAGGTRCSARRCSCSPDALSSCSASSRASPR